MMQNYIKATRHGNGIPQAIIEISIFYFFVGKAQREIDLFCIFCKWHSRFCIKNNIWRIKKRIFLNKFELI